MIKISKSIDITLNYSFKNYKKSDLLFFDIETTGLSATNSIIYLIGCCYYDNSTWNYIQWFADTYDSEYDLLINFFELMDNYKLLIHFNGNRFDVPFILKRCHKYNLNYNFNNIENIDIYKLIKPYKNFLNLENCKQKTIEKYLNLSRKDKYSGGELIKVYKNYINCSKLPEDKSRNLTLNQLKNILLCHNRDDIIGLIFVSQILNYIDFINDTFTIEKACILDNTFCIEASFYTNIPTNININNKMYSFYTTNNIITIKIPILNSELKYFYDNYTDYYYLPKEDNAIHKSVAAYVDKDFKIKAKASNCYTRKKGCFIPQFKNNYTPYFKNDYKDKITYIEINDKLLENTTFLSEYIKQILQFTK